MPNDKISTVNTYGAKPGSDPFGGIDESASYEQVANVYKPSAKNDLTAGMDVDEGHGGKNQPVKTIAPNTDDVTIHQSVGEQSDIAGSLTRPAAQYSHDKMK